MSIKEIVTLLCEAREALDELEFATLPDSLRAIAAKLDQALDAALILEKESLSEADKVMLADVEQGIAQELAAAAQPTEKPHPESSFAPGDLVQLRSGGPVMTFCRAQPYGVEVAFMSRDGMQRIFVPVATLMPYKRQLYVSDEATTPPQQQDEATMLPQQQSDQPKGGRLDDIMKAMVTALCRIAWAVERMETR